MLDELVKVICICCIFSQPGCQAATICATLHRYTQKGVYNTLKALSKLEQVQLNCTPDLAPYHILQLIFRDIYSHMITPHFLTIANYCRPVLKLPLSVCSPPILRHMVPSTSTSTYSDKGKLLSWRKTTLLQHNLFANFLTVILELQVTPTLPL